MPQSTSNSSQPPPSPPPPAPLNYGIRTLVGNWNEAAQRRAAQAAAHAERFRTKTSLLDHTEALAEHFLGDVELEAPCDRLHDGACVQLCAIDYRPARIVPPQPMMLSLYVPIHRLRQQRRLSADCAVSVAPPSTATTAAGQRRNSFVIRRVDSSPAGERPELRYGDMFELQLVENDPETGHPLVLFSSPKMLNLMQLAGAGGTGVDTRNGHSEITQSLGVCKRLPDDGRRRSGGSSHFKRTSECWSHDVPSLHCRWKVQHVTPNVRYEMEGEPVPVRW